MKCYQPFGSKEPGQYFGLCQNICVGNVDKFSVSFSTPANLIWALFCALLQTMFGFVVVPQNLLSTPLSERRSLAISVYLLVIQNKVSFGIIMQHISKIFGQVLSKILHDFSIHVHRGNRTLFYFCLNFNSFLTWSKSLIKT